MSESRTEISSLGEFGLIDHLTKNIELQNASSIAGLLLTTECLITEIPEKKEKAPAGHGGGHGMEGMDY